MHNLEVKRSKQEREDTFSDFWHVWSDCKAKIALPQFFNGSCNLRRLFLVYETDSLGIELQCRGVAPLSAECKPDHWEELLALQATERLFNCRHLVAQVVWPSAE